MDDTQQSTASDAAATRKRRSSILKSQRPVRTPFSELEFNVATPTDTAKSRRVSFSRRTGVAEFVTNEATTTWKNFYEEHNKSLESSGNDSEVNAQRQPVEHLGRRIFDQQFEEVEAEDFIRNLAPSHSSNASFNNINFTQQIASLDCTADDKLAAPNSKFELSALTDQQSKLFGNDFTVTGVGEMSGKIDFNFSNIQRIGEKDDLDEIERDLERVSTNVVCPGPLDRHNFSEYIEVDLNMTHVAKNDDCDMSITDTISSPKVQDISRHSSVDKRNNLDKDWMTDKENIAINPYATPLESDNFAVNDQPDQVLVFDGKRLTLQSENPDKRFRQTLLPNTSSDTPLRKTIVLNTNDDLPNFVDDVESRHRHCNLSSQRDSDVCIKAVHKVEIVKKTTVDDTDNISITQSLPTNIVSGTPGIKTVTHTGNETGNISMTQALNGQILTENSKPIDRRRTVVYENETGNISITQALPTNIIQNDKVERRKTIVFDDDKGNISITQALTSQFIVDHAVPERRKTIIYDDDKANVSITQALPSRVILDQKNQEKRKTIVFDDDSGNISITQALPANIVVESRQEKRKTILYEDDTGNISVTQAAPTNLILTGITEATERRRTVLYEDDTGNISVTQAIPQNIILGKVDLEKESDNFDTCNISITQVLPTNIILKDIDTNKRRTIVYDDNTGNISITQVIPSKLITGIASKEDVMTPNDTLQSCTSVSKDTFNKRKTIIYDTEAADVSMTQAIPANIIINNKEEKKKDENEEQSKEIHKDKTIVSDNDVCDNSLAEEVPANLFLLEGMSTDTREKIPVIKDIEEGIEKDKNKKGFENSYNIACKEKRRTVVFANANDDAKMSITQAVPTIQNVIQESDATQNLDKNKGNLSLTKPIPDEVMSIHTDILNKSVEKDLNMLVQNSFCKQNINVVVYQTETIEIGQQADINNDSPSVCESHSIVPNKPDRTEVPESISEDGLKAPSEATPLQSENYVNNVIESKSEVHDIKMKSLYEADKVTGNMVQIVKSNTFNSVSNDPNPKDSKTSVLYTLLDMSDPVESVIYAKNVENDIEPMPIELVPEPEKEASIFSSVSAEDEEIQTDKIEIDKDEELTENESETFHFIRNSPLSIEYKEQEEQLQNTLAKLMNKRDENMLLEASSIDVDEKEDGRVHHRSFKNANDTKELLDMICDFTDNSRSPSKDETISLVKEELPEKKALNVKETLAIENKMETYEPRRLSFATKRQSILISREDLLSNISMAQAILQKSRVEFDDTSLTEDNQDSSPEELSNTLQKSNRMSNEVVKTLLFDDESLSENSLKSDLSKNWPVKKTVFGETSFARDKTNVIPSYLKDVSDGIKQLMSDLVKPMSDAIPFENQEERIKSSISTVSTQIQANLTTSSQIDINTELSSAPVSSENLENVPCNRSVKGILKFPDSSEMSFDKEVVPSEFSETLELPCRLQSNTEPILVFDHDNPLNNILLGPLDYVHAHDYKPLCPIMEQDNLAKKSDETLCGSDRSTSCQINMEIDASSIDTDVMAMGAKNVEVNTEQIVTQYCVSVYGGKEKVPIYKLNSLDRAVDVHSEVEDTEVNTLIAMKANKELLETSSSLTLIETTESDSKTDSIQHSKRKERRTSVKGVVKFKTSAESDITSTDDSADRLVTKGKKRSHIPGTPNRRTSVDVTPKPNSKMLKTSNSPNQNRILLRMSHESTKLPAERDTDGREEGVDGTDEKTKTEKKPIRSYDNTITIQQLITEYQIDAGLSKEILDALKDNDCRKSGSMTTESPSRSESVTSDSLDKISSFTSSKNLRSDKDVQNVPTTTSTHKSESNLQTGEFSRIDWHPELTSLSSSKNDNHFDSGVNIVSKIDMLPFMGSYECQRESSLADMWSFRLLHGRIRLAIRLAHRHDNSTRTRVRADTPVTDVSVDTTEYDKKNPVAILCVRFACETMRYMVSRGSEVPYLARDVPLLLRRCAAVARVALRWGRAMHDAKLHLAYALDSLGHLTLKVANISLRSVWEVSMNLELVVEHSSQTPWPRASNVTVKRVVSDVPVSEEEVKKALKNTPNDWGHVPKTLWRIFRYLKHKQRDDDELLLGV